MKSELNQLLRSYSLSVLTKNADKCLQIVETLHAYFDSRNICVQSRLESCYIHFRGQSFSLAKFADLFRIPTIVVLATYEEFGSVVEMYWRYSGRNIIQHRSTLHDKVEFGNRFHIPWLLLEQFSEDSKEYKFIYEKYTDYSRQSGTIGDMSINSGSKSYAADPKVKKEFESFLKEFSKQQQKVIEEVPRRRQASSDSPISVTQAKAGA